MGFVFSRPAAAAGPTALPSPTLTIRNLTVTSLELRLVERLESQQSPHLHKPKGLVKVSSHLSSRRQSHEPDAPLPLATTALHDEDRPPSSAKQDIVGVALQPFSECHTAVYAPDAARHEQLRLTFEDPRTQHLYSAEIPAQSRRSIVLRAHPKDAEDETKEFTAIYLPQHAYLALFSSANLSSWMSTLDPALPISSLSIPGTHNSPTCHVALPSVRCQAVPVLDQLNNGVRFLDVRVSCPAYTNTEGPPAAAAAPAPELALVHSAFPISLTGPKHLSALLATLYAFLSANPSETVLLSLKREGTGRGGDADLARILRAHYIGPRRSERWYTRPEIPTLAQCAGRIVLVRRFHLDPSTVPASEGGIDGSVWPDNVADGTCGSGTIRIQDYYGVNSGGEIQQKVRFAQEGLARAAAQGIGREMSPEVPLFINFLSASNFFNASCWPDRIAFKINPSMIEYLCMGHGAEVKESEESGAGDAATGIVVTDWVGHHGDWDLVRCIVGWNARLQLRQ